MRWLGPVALAVLATLLPALAVGAAARDDVGAGTVGQSLAAVSHCATGVTAFKVPTPDGVMQLSGGAVIGANDDMVLYAAGNAVYQVQFSAGHTSATLQRTFSYPEGTSYYDMLGQRALSPGLVNGSAWFQTRSGGSGGLVAFTPASTNSLPTEVDQLSGTSRMQYGFIEEGTNTAFVVLNGALYKRVGNATLVMQTQAPNTFDYDTAEWGNQAGMAWEYNAGYVYMFGASHKPGAPSPAAPWFTVTRFSIHPPFANQTLYVRPFDRLNATTVHIPASMFFDAGHMYVTVVPTQATSTSKNNPNLQQATDDIDIVRYELPNAFTGQDGLVIAGVVCPAYYPQPSSVMVDASAGYGYLVCGVSVITRVKLTGSSPGSIESMCEQVLSPGGKLAQYYWPKRVPESQKVPVSFTNYGNVALKSVANYVGWVDLGAVNWRASSCPYPWWTLWWIWTCAGVLALLLVCGCGFCYCSRRAKPRRRPRVGLSSKSTGALSTTYTPLGGGDRA